MNEGMTVTRDIVAKLWNLCHILRDDGVTYNEYVTEHYRTLFQNTLTGKGFLGIFCAVKSRSRFFIWV